MTDKELMAMAIEERNAWLDEYGLEFSRWEAETERLAELAVERYFEEGPHGGWYAGSMEEARDRYYDSLMGL